MSFLPSNLNICRPGIAGFVCLAMVGACRGGEGARNIEVVPLHGTAMDTNFDQTPSTDIQTIKAWAPHAPRPFQAPTSGKQAMPLPRSQPAAPTARERELLDRRKNWVFMTSEDYAADGKNDAVEKNGLDKKSGTVMERYFERLNNSDQAAATNQFSKPNPDLLNGQTNLFGGSVPPVGGGAFGDSPFDSTPGSGVFDSVRRDSFTSVFGSSDSDTAMPTPDDLRRQAEQKAHMESFKQIWNIDQPAVAPAMAPASGSTPVDSGPLFGLASSGIQSPSPVGSLASSPASSQPVTPTPSPITTQRAIRPPRPDFTAPQRPF